jgi:hypothetical protein
MINANEAKTNALGHSQRSLRKDGMVPAGDMGVMICDHPTFGVIRIGAGFTHAQRLTFWNNQNHYKGMTIKFKYQDFGVLKKPRLPVFLGFRDKRDIS